MPIHPPHVFLRRIEGRSVSRIDQILAYAAARIYKDYMYNIGISGITGSGKSTLGITLGIRASGRSFDLDKNIAYTREEILEKAYGLPNRSVLLVDEAIGAQRRRAMEKLQKQLTEMINKIRYKNHLMIWNLPFFVELDPMLRKHFDLWIHVYDRGKAVVLIRNYNPLAPDPWMPARWAKYYSQKPATTPEQVKQILMKHPLYRFTLRFGKLPDSIEKVYKAYSALAKSKLEESKQEKPYLRMLKTTSAQMAAHHVITTMLLAQLFRTGKLTPKDVDNLLHGVVLRPDIRDLITDMMHKPDWFPPDGQKFKKYVYQKAAYYAQGL